MHPLAVGSVAEGYLHMSPEAGLGRIASVVVIKQDIGSAPAGGLMDPKARNAEMYDMSLLASRSLAPSVC